MLQICYTDVRGTLSFYEFVFFLMFSFAEKGVLAHFIILALLWIVRDPKFIPGWSAIFEKG